MATSATVNLYGCCTEEWKTDVITHEGEWRLRDTQQRRERENKKREQWEVQRKTLGDDTGKRENLKGTDVTERESN